MAKGNLTNKSVYCSFCEKSNHDVFTVISGPKGYICNECVNICISIMNDVTKKDNVSLKKHLPFLSELSLIPKTEDHDLSEFGFTPRFNKIRFKRKEKYCFYLCPFKEPFNEIYSDHAKPAIEQSGFTVERADEIFGTQPIIEDIWESINSAEIIIADVTDKNPNVMYEVGMAHTVGKPVVIITQKIEDVPFDLQHHRCIIYKHTPKGCSLLEEKLIGTLRFISNPE